MDNTEPAQRVMYLRCGRCTICIGPGFYCNEIWYDPSDQRRLCRKCGEAREAQGAFLIVTYDELAQCGGGSALVALLKARAEGT